MLQYEIEQALEGLTDEERDGLETATLRVEVLTQPGDEAEGMPTVYWLAIGTMEGRTFNTRRCFHHEVDAGNGTTSRRMLQMRDAINNLDHIVADDCE